MAEAFASRVGQAWAEALAVWDCSTTLSPPDSYEGKGASHWKQGEPLAYIDLATRQVVVNVKLLDAMGAGPSLAAVLAHEIGHHVRFPHTLSLSAALQLLEKRLIPGLGQSLTNLFFDLQVNEFVGRTRADDLIAVYLGFLKQDSEMHPVFAFYLAIYEELWQREPGCMVPAKVERDLERRFPGFRADAKVFAQTFYALPDVYRQFVYFCARFIRYVEDPANLSLRLPLGHDVPAPDLDDLDAAVRGAGAEAIEEALAEAREKGWLKESGLTDPAPSDAFGRLAEVTNHLPGEGGGAFKLALVSKQYRRLVDEYILKLPAATPPPERVLPGTAEEWEWGDDPRAIDWTLSVITEGALAGVRPKRRELLPDEPAPLEEGLPCVEIYLDTSGSMPDPATALNAMTLAAQVLSASTIRKGGKMRAIVYSWGKPLVSGWMADEEHARQFLLHYVGGGTDYPFAILRESALERDDVMRVVISDSDFLSNVQGQGAMDVMKLAAERSRLLVAFLGVQGDWADKTLAPLRGASRFRLVKVASYDQFARAAADLAEAILPTRERR